LTLSSGCGHSRHQVSADDASAIQRSGNRVTVPASSPLAARLEIEPAKLTTITRQMNAPASVEAHHSSSRALADSRSRG